MSTAKTAKPAADNPYRPGSMYHTLFAEGSRKYRRKEDIISQVAAMEKKSTECISFAWSVIASRGGRHSSNGGRSTAIFQGRLVKLLALRKKPRPFPGTLQPSTE